MSAEGTGSREGDFKQSVKTADNRLGPKAFSFREFVLLALNFVQLVLQCLCQCCALSSRCSVINARFSSLRFL